MTQSRKRKRLSSPDQSTESVSNSEKAENLSNVISHWKRENTTEYQAVSTAHKLSTREQLVHSTPWMKEFVLEILSYPGFCEEIVGCLRLHLLAQICSDPLREV